MGNADDFNNGEKKDFFFEAMYNNVGTRLFIWTLDARLKIQLNYITGKFPFSFPENDTAILLYVLLLIFCINKYDYNDKQMKVLSDFIIETFSLDCQYFAEELIEYSSVTSGQTRELLNPFLIKTIGKNKSNKETICALDYYYERFIEHVILEYGEPTNRRDFEKLTKIILPPAINLTSSVMECYRQLYEDDF